MTPPNADWVVALEAVVVRLPVQEEGGQPYTRELHLRELQSLKPAWLPSDGIADEATELVGVPGTTLGGAFYATYALLPRVVVLARIEQAVNEALRAALCP